MYLEYNIFLSFGKKNAYGKIIYELILKKILIIKELKFL